MKYLLQFIEFASLILTTPEALPVARQYGHRERFAMASSALASLSLATGVFYLRSSYSLVHLLMIPLLAGFIFLFHRIYSGLMAARLLQRLMNSMTDSQTMTGAARALTTVLEASFLPGLFLLPVCITSKEFPIPSLVLLPGMLALSFWIFYIQYAGVRIIMETQRRITILLLVRNHAMLIVYPFLAIYVGMLLMVSLTAVQGY